jgi:WD40 repeat protein/transcriptional regulator with XRE-family HTH domain
MANQPFSPDSFQTFGELLKYLRRRERLTQLELSITVGYSEAQIGRLEKNQRRPDLTGLKALFIPALHLDDEPELIARFLELAQSARQEDAPTPGYAPYKGLLFFDEADADLFFGRENLITHLTNRVVDLASDASTRLLAVVGASGSGKSSLVRAGLLVAIKLAGWGVRVFTPGADPLKALEMQLDVNQATAESERVLMLVDQFEEVFTLCRDESERVRFIEKLLELATLTPSPLSPRERGWGEGITVVIALRADFYSHCAQYPSLRNAVAAQQEYIGQMTAQELRRAIEEPAKRGGWDFEPRLVDVLLQDIGVHGVSEPEPGALPLLSHALLATWERRRGRTFTLDGYHAIGGVRGAIAETAESVFTDQLNGQQQGLAREVFLRLTELGEGTEDTRRRAALNELVRQSTEATQLRIVLNTLAEARLITLNEDSAEVAHEALIREWQRLHEWLTNDRDGLRLHRHLTDSAHEWETRGQDASELYRGARLAQAREWADANEGSLNESERAFLTASIEQEHSNSLEREVQRQRELEAAQKLAESERRAASRLRQRAFYLAGAFVLALVLAGIAWVFNGQANTQQQIAFTRELSASAISNLSTDPERSILLSLEAVNISLKNDQPVLIEAQDALHRSIQTSRVRATLRGHEAGGSVWALDISPDGKHMATIGEDRTVRIWDLTTNEVVSTLQVDTDFGPGGHGVAFSPDGKQLLTVSGEANATLLDVSTGNAILKLEGHSAHLATVAISSDGKMFATGSDDGTAKLWDATTGKELFTLGDEETFALYITFSPDGKILYTGSEAFPITAWDTATGEKLFTSSEPGGGTDVTAIAASPDGMRVATGDFDTTVKIWDAATGELLLKLFGHSSYVSGLAFSPDGKMLATASEDGSARLWDAETGKALLTLSGHASGVLSAAFSADGARLYTSSRDGTGKIWNLSTSAGSEALNLVGHTGRVATVAYRPDGKQLATFGWDGTVRIWDAITGAELHMITLEGDYGTGNGYAGNVTYSPDGKRLAYNDLNTTRIIDTANDVEIMALDPFKGGAVDVIFSSDGSQLVDVGADGTIRIHDSRSGKTLVEFQLPAESDGPQEIALSPDGKCLAVAAGNGAYLYDAITGKQILKYSGHGDGVRSSGIAFSPDGKWIASSGNDSTIKVWDAETGVDIFTLSGHTGPTFGVAFNSDGHSLITSSVDRTVKVWLLPSQGESVPEPLTLYGNSGAVYRVALSPDGTRIVSVGRDPTVHIYELNIEELIAIARARLTRELTLVECQKYLHMEACPANP